ncbi:MULTISPECIES: DNA polymerase beta superfamily protein [unclassified Tenacibaculum]|uniref:nucleotidyltransferase domain-containing protein n=1 Tax=unclassified Tenacibaculum TaxID=2635139 RepID=UPI001F21E0F0|nr:MULTISPECIES: nucleotidyltransferase domain-containing protein [unclassified Tenacibaculum]MCF2875740.1 nucleotidyltransferase domain-containing protein [Tenacibaculum sp. Cn5-1]MCF2935816.1 nucleotidyltransferase domain-containing protein [Tenacibaculum sp. Cn5-34]MCG7512376.1 nucleotidyltransferase domain-containing protein [Tenacibaculum sp. Cn5-46]
MKTVEELKKSGSIIFECTSGSRAYGLATPNSDTDIRGVFILPKEQFYSLNYTDQINNETNDIVYYELKKFIELCLKNNPNILEMLNVSDEFILQKNPLFDEIKKEIFLSKLCKNTFANYAFTQIKKARGLNKKIVNPVEKQRKSVDDFCFIRKDKKSIPLKLFLEERNLKSKHCGLAKIAHMKNCYNLFYNENLFYKGISKEKANEVCLSSIPREEEPIAMLYFNLDGYSSYCKKYREYWLWVEQRNDERYKNNISHNKNYDAKNMMHTFRLLHMAKEIAEEAKIKVKREDRDYLLSIKNADFEYDGLVEKAEELRMKLDILYEKAQLKEKPDMKEVNNLLVTIRTKFYKLNLEV